MLDYITVHWQEFSAMGAALMVLGGVIVKLTPTKTDDKWWQAITSFLGKKSQATEQPDS